MAYPISNLVIDKLPPEIRERLLAACESIALPIRTHLYRAAVAPRHIHFITSGIASIVAVMSNGDSVEVALIGREGIPEAIHLLGPTLSTTECFSQIAGTALRMDFKRFQDEFFTLEPVRQLMLRQVQYNTHVIGQGAACNRLHDVEERLARWLLMVSDRIDSPDFYLTQEFLAEMIGSRRSTVTLTAGTLKRSGLIDYRRGEVHIIDRDGLEDSACECYEITRRLLKSLQG